MIRSTINESIMSASKLAGSDVGPGESYELVLGGLNAGVATVQEKRDIDARETYQTQTPSNPHNGITE